MNRKYNLNLQPGKTYRMKNATDEEWISKRFDGASLQGDEYGVEVFLVFDGSPIRADIFTRFVLTIEEEADDRPATSTPQMPADVPPD